MSDRAASERGTSSDLQLELVRLDGNNLENRQRLDELLRSLANQTRLLQVPAGSLQVQARHEAALVRRLADVIGVGVLCDGGVERRLVERPCVLAASGLHEGGQVRLRDV